MRRKDEKKMTPNKYQKAALRTESPLPWMKADDNSLEKVMQMNLDKLAARYPDGFESEKSQHRTSEDV